MVMGLGSQLVGYDGVRKVNKQQPPLEKYQNAHIDISKQTLDSIES